MHSLNSKLYEFVPSVMGRLTKNHRNKANKRDNINKTKRIEAYWCDKKLCMRIM